MRPVIKLKPAGDKEKVTEKDQKGGSSKSALSNKTAQLLSQMSISNQSKPTNVEAQRILTIIEALIDKVQVVAYLDGEFMGNFTDSSRSKATEEFLNILTEKTGKMIIKEGELENKLRPHLLASESQGTFELIIRIIYIWTLDKNNDPDKSENGGVDFSELGKVTRNNIRNLVRSLQDNPPDLEAIKV